MKNYLKQILFGLILTLLTGLFLTQVNTAQASFPSSGYYTNLYGGGANLGGVTTHTGSYCNSGFGPSNGLATGECKIINNLTNSSGAHIEEYVCNGKTTNCNGGNGSSVLSGYPLYSTDFFMSADSHTNQCNYTIQLDVFNSGPTANANPVDYITWYSGDCVSPTATPTPTTIPSPTPTPTRVPTATVTPSPTPKPTTTPTPTGVPSVTPTPTIKITPTPTTAPVVTPTPGSDTTFQCPTADGGTVNITVSNSSAANFNCNSVIVNVTNTSNSTSSATGGSVTVEATPAISDVKELPKTGLPIEAWGLSGMLPIGFGLKKFVGDKNMSKVASSATYIWQQREFLKK